MGVFPDLLVVFSRSWGSPFPICLPMHFPIYGKLFPDLGWQAVSRSICPGVSRSTGQCFPILGEPFPDLSVQSFPDLFLAFPDLCSTLFPERADILPTPYTPQPHPPIPYPIDKKRSQNGAGRPPRPFVSVGWVRVWVGEVGGRGYRRGMGADMG